MVVFGRLKYKIIHIFVHIVFDVLITFFEGLRMSMEIFVIAILTVIMKLILTDLMTIILLDIAKYLSGRITEF